MCSAINLHILKYKIDKTMNKTIRLGLIYKLIYNHCNEFCIGLTIDTFRYEMTFFRHKLIFSTILFFREGKHKATCSQDKTIKFYLRLISIVNRPESAAC